jgi:hypothetical protein
MSRQPGNTQWEAEDPSSLAGKWYNDLLQQPPSPHSQQPTNHSQTDQDTDSDNESTSPDPAITDLQLTTTFHLFPLLPKDIRLLIYHLHHPHPQNVLLSFPQNPHARARTPNWDKQWIFPSLPLSHFSSLLICRESRDFFLSHYLLIFSSFPSNEEKIRQGRKPGWYFSPREDSLCFGDGIRGLRWFVASFPEEEVWERVRWIDVDVDLCAFHKQESVHLDYFSNEAGCDLVLGRMKELRVVSLRVLVVREGQWMKRKNGYWRPWENSGIMLREWLKGLRKEGGRGVRLAMQYVWVEGKDPEAGHAVAGHVASKEGHDAFLKRYPGKIEEGVRRRWVEMEIFLQDGGIKTQTVYNTEKEIFCRNLEIGLD